MLLYWDFYLYIMLYFVLLILISIFLYIRWNSARNIFFISSFIVSILWIINYEFIEYTRIWAIWNHSYQFLYDYHITLNPLAIFNFYKINGVYTFIELQNTFLPFFEFFPFGFLIILWNFHKNSLKNFSKYGIRLIFSLICIHAIILIICYFLKYFYIASIFDSWKSILNIFGFCCGWLFAFIINSLRNYFIKKSLK